MKSLTKISVVLLFLMQIGLRTPSLAMGTEPDHEWIRYLVKEVEPEYPRLLWNRGIQGRGLYRLIINQKTGEVDEVKVLKSPAYAILNEYAAKAFLQWKFKPGTVREAVIPFEWYVHGFARNVH